MSEIDSLREKSNILYILFMFYLVYSYVVEQYYHVDKKGGNLRPLRMKFKTYKQNLRPFQGLKFRFSNLRLFQVFKTPRVPCLFSRQDIPLMNPDEAHLCR